MFKSLKAFFKKVKEAKNNECYTMGYNWAAGGLLRKEIDPYYIDCHTSMYGDDMTQFDRGARQAMFDAIKAGICEDNTI